MRNHLCVEVQTTQEMLCFWEAETSFLGERRTCICGTLGKNGWMMCMCQTLSSAFLRIFEKRILGLFSLEHYLSLTTRRQHQSLLEPAFLVCVVRTLVVHQLSVGNMLSRFAGMYAGDAQR